MDPSRNTAFCRRVLLLYQNTRAVRVLLDDCMDQIDEGTRSWLEQAARQNEEINRRTGAGLFPPSTDEYEWMLSTNRRLREICDQVAPEPYRDFDGHLTAHAAAAWHKDYQFG